MAKKFFYNKVYNTKKTIINLIIIGVCVIGIIICFIVTSNFQGKSNNSLANGTLNIKNEVTVEVNDKFTNEIFFSKIENVDVNTIKVNYPNNYDVSVPGTYKIELIINNETYNTNLIVVDTTKPELTVKEVTINKGDNYNPNSFVESCKDNSGKECKIAFYEGIDTEGNKVDYSNYKDAGTYTIKISAKDNSDNEKVQETKLIIKDGDGSTEPPTQTPSGEDNNCKYGNNEYDTDNYLLAIDITSNKCAVSIEKYKDETMTKEINKLMETETTKIKKDVEALNLTGSLTLNRKITAIINTSGDGIVGYELRMTVLISTSGKSQTITDYKINSSGKRVFITNPYNLAS